MYFYKCRRITGYFQLLGKLCAACLFGRHFYFKNMFPFLDLHFVKVPMYGLSIVLGITLAVFAGYYLCKLKNRNFYDFIIISTVAIAFGFIFAKLLYIVVSYPFSQFFKTLIFTILHPREAEAASGFVFYGGLIGGILGYLAGIKIAGCSFFDFPDFYGVLIPLIHGFGRIGCFCAGCCYGIPYEGPLAVYYKNPVSSAPVGIALFPVQLLESFLLFILAAILFILFKKGRKFIFLIYLFSYCIIRFITEFFRFDSERGQIGILSVSQFISILLFAGGIIIFLILKKCCRNK